MSDDAVARVVSVLQAFEDTDLVCGSESDPHGIRVGDLRTILARLAVAEEDVRRMDVLRPFLSVGGSGGDETWGLWCVAESQYAEEDAVAALYWRGAADDAEEQKRENGEAEWGPSVDGMLDEMIAIDAVRTAERGDA